MCGDLYILIINPGSTSTKIAVFHNQEEELNISTRHTSKELAQYKSVWEQYEMRKQAVLQMLTNNNWQLEQFDVIVARGGTVKPIEGGIYRINQEMLKDMKSGFYGNHACNVGCQIAYDLGQEIKIPVITVDPPVTDELSPYARYSGIPQISRQSSFHALNQKATARKMAEKLGQNYNQLNLIVVHLGGGISVAAHKDGKVIDVNNALNGDGPFAPERAGSLPVGDLIRLCFSGNYTENEMMRLVCGGGGLLAYLGTTDALAIEERIDKGDQQAEEIFLAMGYQIAKEIGASAAVLDGEVKAIALTGSLAKSARLVNLLKDKIGFIAPVHLFPGENEIEALMRGALRYLKGEKVLNY